MTTRSGPLLLDLTDASDGAAAVRGGGSSLQGDE